MRTPPAWILLDIGGVLVEVDAARRLDEWTAGRLRPEDFWTMWLTSPAVKRFETGKTDGPGFAREAVSEFGLDIPPEAFLADFQDWLVGPWPGIPELLDSLRERFPLACLSNSSCVHWPLLEAMLDIPRRFQKTFATHHLGVLKPDPKVFAIVLETLAVPPEEIWFFDDNRMNVEAAQAAGMQAWLVKDGTALQAQLDFLLS